VIGHREAQQDLRRCAGAHATGLSLDGGDARELDI
jgi:hypothetical protein